MSEPETITVMDFLKQMKEDLNRRLDNIECFQKETSSRVSGLEVKVGQQEILTEQNKSEIEKSAINKATRAAVMYSAILTVIGSVAAKHFSLF